MPMEMARDLVQLQAIIASLPMHAVPRSTLREYAASDMLAQCGGVKYRPPEVDKRSHADRVDEALKRALLDYPDFQEMLGGLHVVHASLDLVCLAHHEKQMLFAAVRGTDRNLNLSTTLRDWSNNFRIAVGASPAPRAQVVQEEYQACRRDYATYSAYGTGHSLGGAVALHLAEAVEPDPILRFARVDVFNVAISPLSQSFAQLAETELHVHRVYGDWASWGLSWHTVAPHEVHTHPLKPEVPEKHSLRHFLPRKAGDRLALAEELLEAPAHEEPAAWLTLLSSMSCVCSRKKSLQGQPPMERSASGAGCDVSASPASDGHGHPEAALPSAGHSAEAPSLGGEGRVQPVHWPTPSPITSPRRS